MGTGRQYDEEFKKQAIKLAKEIGNKGACEELGIPKGTLSTWVGKAKAGEIDIGTGTRSPEESLNLAQQLQAANKQIKELEKANRELEEASAFFRCEPSEVGKEERLKFIAIKTDDGRIIGKIRLA